MSRMQTPPAARPAPAPQAAPVSDPAALLAEVIRRTPSQQVVAVKGYLEKDDRVAQLEDLLPPGMKGQAKRLADRAVLTLARRAELRECPPHDFVRCVLEAAECGLAIDGKLGYVVKYKNQWQFQADYKGLKAVAVRSGQIKDAWARLVHQNDRFRAWEVDGVCHLEHEQPERFGARGPIIGAYAVIVLPEGRWRYELMSVEELDAIRKRSAAYTSSRGPSGPWVTDEGEMRKKTILRRALKLYCDDPAFVRLCQIEDDDKPATERERAEPPPATTDDPLAEELGLIPHKGNGSETESPAGEPEPDHDEPDNGFDFDPDHQDAVNEIHQRITDADSDSALAAVQRDIEAAGDRYNALELGSFAQNMALKKEIWKNNANNAVNAAKRLAGKR